MLSNEQIYKQKPIVEIKTRTIRPLSDTKKLQLKATLNNFVAYLKAAHS